MTQVDTLTEAITEANRGNWIYVDHIAQLGSQRAVPILQGIFSGSQDVDTKERAAFFLYRFGDSNGVYWNYLLDQARLVVEDNAPFRYSYDSQGKMAGESPEFAAWAKLHSTTPQAAYEETLKGIVRLNTLIKTEDTRAIPLLRRGLQSPNQMVEGASAKGLAQLQDKDSIPLIIEACQRAPGDGASLIADSLVYFDDPSAQAAADSFLPKDKVTAIRDQVRLHGHKPFGSPRTF
jgi:HEAT repeat protein